MDRLLFCQEIWSVWSRLLQFARLVAFCTVTLHISHVTDIFHYDAQWNVISVTIFIVMQFKLCIVWRRTCCMKKREFTIPQLSHIRLPTTSQVLIFQFEQASILNRSWKLGITCVSIFCQCDDSEVRVLQFIRNCSIFFMFFFLLNFSF